MAGPLTLEAEDLLDSVSADPAGVLLSELPDRARQAGDSDAEAIALRAKGLAAANLDRLEDALVYLDKARRLTGVSSKALLGVLNTYGVVLAWIGRGQEGEAVLTGVVSKTRGSMKAQALVQRGAIRFRRAFYKKALADFAAAERIMAVGDPTSILAHLLNNRGLALVMLGRPREAITSLEAAHQEYLRVGATLEAATTLHNLGWAAGRLGDIPKALSYFDRAEEELVLLEGPLGELWRDRADVMAVAGLADEAMVLARRAVYALGNAGHYAAQAEAQVRLAEIALAAHKPDDAIQAAQAAVELFRLQQRPRWLDHAQLVALRASFESGAHGRRQLMQVEALVRRLQQAAMDDSAAAARILAARIAIRLGNRRDAARQLAGLDEASHRLDLRVGLLLCKAEFRLAENDRRGALSLIRMALSEVERYRAIIGSSELRALLSAHIVELSRMALVLVREMPGRILFDWLERTRAGALQFPSVTPPDDAGMAADLAELRAVEARLKADPDLTVDSLRRQRVRIEERVRRRQMRVQGVSEARLRARLPLLKDVLGSRQLISLAIIEGELVAVVIREGRVRRRSLGRIELASDHQHHLRWSMSRLGQITISEGSRQAAATSAFETLSLLDHHLLAPLKPADRETVIVPSAELQSIPWSLLPSFRGVPVSVVPSASIWTRAMGVGAAGDHVVVAAGPGLSNAASEVRAVAGLHREVRSFPPSKAKVEEVSKALSNARIAHLACHGKFRSDSPLFSSLELSDGGLTVYDLERMIRPPALLVLSACDVGQTAARPGDEPLGVVSALLALGTKAVIASPMPVPDAPVTRRQMVWLHRSLSAGHGPAAALASAQLRLDLSSPLDLAAASFVCFGAG